jgi:putative serine protease PepD
VGTDPSTDLAVIQMQQPPKDLHAATFGNSSLLKVGDPVMAVGNPLGLSDTVTTGIVSALNRPVCTGSGQGAAAGGSCATGSGVFTNAIQTDAAVNPGNSGGALVNAGGRVVGITSSIASLGSTSATGQSGNIGLGFAIPSGEVSDVADQLVKSGGVQHALIGIGLTGGTVTVDGADRQAAVVSSVTAGTAAAKAGLQTKDAIVAVDGQTLDGPDSLVARVRALRPGTKVTLTVVRAGKSLTVPLTLGARPTGN